MGVPGKILCILMLLLHKSSQLELFNDKETLNLPLNYVIGWMGTLDDEKLVTELTIPGTHDSLALHGGPAAECQAWSLENQLKAGIRYFDLRVSGDDLKVVHGPISQHTTFYEVLNGINNFLSIYPTETVLVRVKHSNVFPDHVISELEQNTNSWVNVKTIPKIKEVRGKIVFIQKKSFHLGLPLHETDEKGDYKVGRTDEKKKKIIEHLNEALEACKHKTAVLIYSSGTGWPLGNLVKTPKYVAKKINPWLYNYLLQQNIKGCFGIIAMDFPGFDLIQKVINFNK
ncbi:1-phosphatidylinositol phosphodiesterase-like [Siphateles boraxobius]|uniref:1-phosphatidylinositol phosphodiesterase-like n=1 Tax=Siphateles boraxobius TaxID=180520 RepID=UPI0040634C97